MAIENGQLVCMKVLINEGASVNLADPGGITTLMTAVASRSLAFVKLLVNAGASVNSRDLHGRSVLRVHGWREHCLYEVHSQVWGSHQPTGQPWKKSFAVLLE